MIIVGNGIYEICPKCKKLVKINKFIFGSLHYCDSDDELESKKRLLKIYKLKKKEDYIQQDYIRLAEYTKEMKLKMYNDLKKELGL